MNPSGTYLRSKFGLKDAQKKNFASENSVEITLNADGPGSQPDAHISTNAQIAMSCSSALTDGAERTLGTQQWFSVYIPVICPCPAAKRTVFSVMRFRDVSPFTKKARRRNFCSALELVA